MSTFKFSIKKFKIVIGKNRWYTFSRMKTRNKINEKSNNLKEA